MRIRIQHETIYAYAEPVSYSIQALRLRPLDTAGQKILNWWVETPASGSVRESRDVYGNVLQMLYVERLHDRIVLKVAGEVETFDTGGVATAPLERFAPRFYLRTTPLTEADQGIAELADAARGDANGKPLDFAHSLMNRTRAALDYKIGQTDSGTTAAEALANGSGVCQDHAHVFISAARLNGLPARYVSGYLWTEDGSQNEAAHAWAEAYIEDLGWVGFDVANGISPTVAHVRVASGLDYLEAAPIRGLRRGGGQETLEVRVRVAEGAGQQ
ncbi:MAG: transglutaminase family protein [Parvibaculum sp.]|uniref:transglutaminase family protein n=1 Tax=Parvibaculum sp. TaxID=2024848 RepID=UPI0025F5A0EE|nr:transglutaminase family protein [Parvibaculum sp.]MCE9648482.1 transglutaminase family protein [Parvibaculum sp.]